MNPLPGFTIPTGTRRRASCTGHRRSLSLLDQGVPENLDVVEKEFIPLQHLDDPFKGMAEKSCELLEQFRLLT